MNAATLATTDALAASLSSPVVKPSELPHGLHHDYAAEDYHHRELGMASKGALDLVRRSPAHYLAWLGGEDKPETKPFAFGTALHMRLLEPDRFERTYLVAPEFGPRRKTDACSSEQAKENKTRRTAWMAEHAGATVLDAQDGMATLAMIEALAEHPIARPLLEGAESEVTARWRCPASGLECKARADSLQASINGALDLKSAVDASPDAFRRTVANFGYHRQHAHYESGFAGAGHEIDSFTFIVVEKAPPFAVAVYLLDADAVRVGRRQVEAAKRTLADCLARNVFPAYRETIFDISLPTWSLQE